MPGRLQGKTAVVTGAASGLGRAISLAFAKEGATVICADVQEKEGRDVTERILKETDNVAIFTKTDVSIALDIEKLVSLTVSKCGRLDM